MKTKMSNEFAQGTLSRRTLLMGAAMSSAWQAFAKETPENARCRRGHGPLTQAS